MAAAVGLACDGAHFRKLIEAGIVIKRAVAASAEIVHPFEDDLGFLYGVIFVDAYRGGMLEEAVGTVSVLTAGQIKLFEEYNEVRLAGAVNIDFYAPDFADQLDGLDKNDPYVMYCRSGNRSSEAIETMKDLGFVEVYEVDGGIVDWYDEGFPVEQ